MMHQSLSRFEASLTIAENRLTSYLRRRAKRSVWPTSESQGGHDITRKPPPAPSFCGFIVSASVIHYELVMRTGQPALGVADGLNFPAVCLRFTSGLSFFRVAVREIPMG